jgi:hypothetical protein
MSLRPLRTQLIGETMCAPTNKKAPISTNTFRSCSDANDRYKEHEKRGVKGTANGTISRDRFRGRYSTGVYFQTLPPGLEDSPTRRTRAMLRAFTGRGRYE